MAQVRTYIFVPSGKFASTNQKHYQDLVGMLDQYGVFVLVSETSFCRETSGGVRKSPLWGGTVSVLLGNYVSYIFTLLQKA